MSDKFCPCCGRHCPLDDPHCERGREYAKTGVMPNENRGEEHGKIGHHEHRHGERHRNHGGGERRH